VNQFKLLCLGDSLTEGYDIDPNTCWVNLLSEREGWDIVNAGISGDMTAGMLARLPLELDKNSYTHVLIMGGTNDVEFGLQPNLIISNIKAVMRQLRYRDIHYTVGIPMQFNDVNSTLTRFQYVDDGPIFRKKIDAYAEELKSFLEEDETDFIDFRDYFTDEKGQILSDLFLLDGVHPNEKGHKLIFRLVLDHYLKL
jgi:lysophospholipase L1-like esterase